MTISGSERDDFMNSSQEQKWMEVLSTLKNAVACSLQSDSLVDSQLGGSGWQEMAGLSISVDLKEGGVWWWEMLPPTS